MSVIISLIALILALAAGYFFLQWKCPTKKDKLQSLLDSIEIENLDFNEENVTPWEIKEKKKELDEGIKKAKELQKKKSDELSAEESKSISDLPILLEIRSISQDIKSQEDLGKKVYGGWDYVAAGGIVVGVFLVSVWLVGKVFGVMELGEK